MGRLGMQYNMRPIFAQQSIRELTRTGREADEVMDAALWAVLQEGYKNGFGADADHLKTIEDVDRMVDAGFTFFTIDPGNYVVNVARLVYPVNALSHVDRSQSRLKSLIGNGNFNSVNRRLGASGR